MSRVASLTNCILLCGIICIQTSQNVHHETRFLNGVLRNQRATSFCFYGTSFRNIGTTRSSCQFSATLNGHVCVALFRLFPFHAVTPQFYTNAHNYLTFTWIFCMIFTRKSALKGMNCVNNCRHSYRVGTETLSIYVWLWVRFFRLKENEKETLHSMKEITLTSCEIAMSIVHSRSSSLGIKQIMFLKAVTTFRSSSRRKRNCWPWPLSARITFLQIRMKVNVNV